MKHCIQFTFALLIAVACKTGKSFAQTIPNGDFENWTSIGGWYENPDAWTTNNAINRISVSKTNDSYAGNFALQVINNGPSFEGPLPGYATIVYANNNVVNKISAYIKCDSISGTGKGIISVNGYLGATNKEIGRWETNIEIPQYTLIEILLDTLNNYDSIKIQIESFSEMDALGQPTGYARLKVDQLTEVITSGIKELNFNKSLKISPNPFKEYTMFIFENSQNEKTTLSLYDTQGQLAQTINNITTAQIRVERGNLSSGIYIFKIQSGGNIGSGKLVVK